MCRAYLHVLDEGPDRVQRKVYNVGGINHTVTEIANIVRENVPGDIAVETKPTDDNRSYRISSELIKEELGFAPIKDVADSVRDLVAAFGSGLIPDSFDDSKYVNIQRMNEYLGTSPAN